MKAKFGDTVKIEYTGTLANGDVFDSNVGGDPLKFEIGSGMVIPGFEELVLATEKGETGEATLPLGKAYGPHREELVQTVPNEFFGDFEYEEGWVLSLENEDGDQMPALVKEIGETETILDLNHPLAGQELKFQIKVIDIIPRTLTTSGDAN